MIYLSIHWEVFDMAAGQTIAHAPRSLGLTEKDGFFLIEVVGEFNYSSVSGFYRLIQHVLTSRPWLPVVVNLIDVTILDGNGLGALVGGLKKVRPKGGDICLIVTPNLRRIFEITGLDRLFYLLETEEEIPQYLENRRRIG